MNPSTIFQLLTQDGAHILAISKVIGIQNVLNVTPRIEAILKNYAAGGLVAVLEKNGPDIQAIVEEIGLSNLGTLSPNAAAIVKTLTAA